jgi:hypothetical protein
MVTFRTQFLWGMPQLGGYSTELPPRRYICSLCCSWTGFFFFVFFLNALRSHFMRRCVPETSNNSKQVLKEVIRAEFFGISIISNVAHKVKMY